MLRTNKELTVDVKNRMGGIGCIRFNHLYPPFDNPAIRRLVLSAVNQRDFMEAYAGAEPELYRTGVGLFTPGTPMATDAGVEVMKGRTDFDKIKQELAAAGYKGEKVILLAPSTIPSLHAQVAGGGRSAAAHGIQPRLPGAGMGHGRRAAHQQGAAGQGRLAHLHHQPDQLQQRVRSGADRHPQWAERMVRLAERAEA